MKLTAYECTRCPHTWFPRTEKKPKVCPKCKSPYWDTQRRQKPTSYIDRVQHKTRITLPSKDTQSYPQVPEEQE